MLAGCLLAAEDILIHLFIEIILSRHLLLFERH